jgi:metal-responsive CopG/Arc/MetJ family transcriptional regulator
MPNAPAENTVSTSFTLPRGLMEAIEQRSKIEMTNKSELIRRALMNYLTTDERAQVLREMAAPNSFRTAPETKVSYRKSKSRKRQKH